MVVTAEQKVKILEFWYEAKPTSWFLFSYAVSSTSTHVMHLKTMPYWGLSRTLRERVLSTAHTHKGKSGRPAGVSKTQANIDAVRDSAIENKNHGGAPSELQLQAMSRNGWFGAIRCRFVLSWVIEFTVTVLKMAWCLFSINIHFNAIRVVILSE